MRLLTSKVVRRVSTACSMWIMMIIDFAFRKIMWESDNVLHVRSLWSVLGKGGWCNISIVPIRNHNMLSSQSTRKLIIWHKPTWTACQEFSMNCSFVWRDLVDLLKCRGVRKNITGNPHVMGKNRFPANFPVNKSSDKWFTSIGYFSPDANVSLTSGIFDEVNWYECCLMMFHSVMIAGILVWSIVSSVCFLPTQWPFWSRFGLHPFFYLWTKVYIINYHVCGVGKLLVAAWLAIGEYGYNHSSAPFTAPSYTTGRFRKFPSSTLN